MALNVPAPVNAQIEGLLSQEHNTFSSDQNDQQFARNLIHNASEPGVASDIGSLIKVVQELQLVGMYLKNSISLGKKI